MLKLKGALSGGIKEDGNVKRKRLVVGYGCKFLFAEHSGAAVCVEHGAWIKTLQAGQEGWRDVVSVAYADCLG